MKALIELHFQHEGMAISENNSSSAELNAKSLETQIIIQKYEQNIAKITKR
jgi:hypothetical protein